MLHGAIRAEAREARTVRTQPERSTAHTHIDMNSLSMLRLHALRASFILLAVLACANAAAAAAAGSARPGRVKHRPAKACAHVHAAISVQPSRSAHAAPAQVDVVWRQRREMCTAGECANVPEEDLIACLNQCTSPACHEEVYGEEPVGARHARPRRHLAFNPVSGRSWSRVKSMWSDSGRSRCA